MINILSGLLREVWKVKMEEEKALEKETHMELCLTTKAVSQRHFNVAYISINNY